MNNEEKILQQLFEQPFKSFHIRLLARATNLNPNTVIKITDSLVQKGMITKTKDQERHIVSIKAKLQNQNFKLKKLNYNLEKIYQSGLINFLDENLEQPTIILFGSYAKAENHLKSDLDLFIVTPNKKEIDLSKYEKKLNTEIQIFIHTPSELKQLTKRNPELVNNIINGIVLSGFLEVL